jgi:hypothetical protein
MTRSLHLALFVILCALAALSQTPGAAAPQAPSPIDRASFAYINIPKLDRAPSMQDFEGMQPVSDVARHMYKVDRFIARVPVDDVPSSERTEVYLGYDSANIYAVFICFDSQPDKMRARRPSRDNVFDDDSITLQLDTFHDQQRAYSFGVNAGGMQGDAVWTEGAGWDPNFDAIYRSEVKRNAQGYIAFLAVPFRSMRFPTVPSQKWGILLNRFIARTREDTFWPRYTQKIQGRTNQMGDLTGLEDVTAGRNIQFVPYVAFLHSKLLQTNDGSPTQFDQHDADFRAGMDAKYVWHDKLTFDLTANPDFSQVESDDPQVLVNQRFEVFFPEKRLFFLENSSYFQTPIQLLFTRRLVKPDAGLRVTGKLGRWGIGLLSADDRDAGERLPFADPNADKRSFTNVARITRDLGPQTYVGMDFVQHSFAGEQNIAFGSDVLYKLNENWRVNSQFVASSTQAPLSNSIWGEALYGGLFEDGNHWTAHFEYNDRSPDFRADVGFIPRVDYRGVNDLLQYNFRPKHSVLVRWGPLLNASSNWDYRGQNLDWATGPGVQFEFKRNTEVDFTTNFGGLSLRPIDFSPLPDTRSYQVRSIGGHIGSTPINKLSFAADFSTNRTVNFAPASGSLPANVSALSGSATVGVRPTNGLTIDNTYLFTQLGDERTNATIFNDHIFRSRWLYQFDQRWSLRLTGQYNALISNPSLTSLQQTKQINGDALLAYRVNPATALFVGYNYDVQNYDPRTFGQLPPIARTADGLINDGRVLFVKLSYLLRY